MLAERQAFFELLKEQLARA
jgi:hypothetical protein